MNEADPAAGPRRPRVLVEGAEEPGVGPGASRLDFGWERAVAPVAPRDGVAILRRGRRWSALSLVAAGAAVLILGLSALDAANFVVAQFARSAWLGWTTLAVAVAGYGLIGWAGLRELRGLWSLSAVDRARTAFARGDHAAARAETLRWAAGIPAAQPHIAALRNAPDIDSLRAVLEAGPLAALDGQAQALGRTAAVQAFAGTAISPSPAWDALLIGWRGVRLVRQVAALHGLRPGLAGTLALLRRTVLDAATVAATDVAVDAATRALLTNPIFEKLAGEAATGAVAARRMLLLSRATAAACRIVPGARD